MEVPQKLDLRYKVDSDMLKQMMRMRLNGLSYRKIAIKFHLTQYTVCQWIDKLKEVENEK